MGKKEIKESEKTSDVTMLIKNLGKLETKKHKYTVGKEEIEIEVAPSIAFSTRLEVVRTISDLVLDIEESSSTIDYQPYYMEFATRYAIVHYYSNVVLPKDVDSMELILMKTTLFNDILEIVEDDIQAIISSAKHLIELRKNYMIQHKDFNDLKERISSILENVTSQFKDIDINKILEQLPKLQDEKVLETMGALMKEKKNMKKK